MAKDGGPAFPQCKMGWFDTGRYVEQVDGGMTLRDWFAGMALQRLCAYDTCEKVAEMSYKYADAILEERDKA